MKRAFDKNTISLMASMIIILFLMCILFRPSNLNQKGIHLPLESGELESIEVIRYRDGGSEKNLITTLNGMQEIYSYWSKVKIGTEVANDCHENVTTYNFLYKNGIIFSIQKGCNYYMQNGKSYEIIEPVSH